MEKQKMGYQEIELQAIDVEGGAREAGGDLDLDLIADVEIDIDIKIGDARLTVAELNAMQPGQTFRLNQDVDEPVQLILNGKVIGAGKLVVVDDRFGVELIKLNT